MEVLPGTTRLENTQGYRQRLRLLDPYSSFATGSVFNTDQVTDNAVNLERLEYTAGTTRVSPQPNWASSLGIKLSDEKRTEQAPDWMKTGDSNEHSSGAGLDSSQPTPVPEADNKSVPDWMRNGGWQESSGNVQEGAVDFTADQPAESLARADIPDWLKSMAPKEVTDAANIGSEQAPAEALSSEEEDVPDWLAGTGNKAADAIPEPSQPNTPAHKNDPFPDWLQGLGEKDSEGAGAVSIDDGSQQYQTKVPQPTLVPSKSDAIAESPSAELQPDGVSPLLPTGESKPQNPEDDSMAWLEGLASADGAKPEEQLIKPESNLDDIPDWLRPIDQAPSSPAILEPPTTPIESKPLEMVSPEAGEIAAVEPSSVAEPLLPESPAEGMPQSLNIEDDTMASLGGLASGDGAKTEEPQTKPQSALEDIPDWLRSLDEQPSSHAAQEPLSDPVETKPLEMTLLQPGEISAIEPAQVEEIPSPELPSEKAQPTVNIGDDTMAWLEGLAFEDGAKPEESLATPEQNSDEMPDWLRSVQEQPNNPAGQESLPESVEFKPLETVFPEAVENAPAEPARPEETLLSEPSAEGTPQLYNLEEDKKAWLEGLDSENDARPEEQLIKPGSNLDDIPEWLRQTEEQPGLSAEPERLPATVEFKPLETPSQETGKFGTVEPSPVAEPLPPESHAEGMPQPLNIEDDTLAWLEGLAAKQGAKEEELLTKPQDRLEEVPEWLRQAEEKQTLPVSQELLPESVEIKSLEMVSPEAGEIAAVEPESIEETPALDFPAEGIPQVLSIEDETMAWLEGLAAKQGAKEEELLTKPEDRLEEVPEWLRKAKEQATPPVSPESFPETVESESLGTVSQETGEIAAVEPEPVEETPALESPAEGIPQALNIEDETMAWLEGLAVKQGAKEEELLTKPEDRLEATPDWLRPTEEQSISPAAQELLPDTVEFKPLETVSLEAKEIEVVEPAPEAELPMLKKNQSEDVADQVDLTAQEPTAPVEEESGTAQIETVLSEVPSMKAGELALNKSVLSEEFPPIPEIRKAEMPDWLRPADVQPSTSAAEGSSFAQSENIPLEALAPHAGEFAALEPAPSEGNVQPQEDSDTMTWLEGLASDQGAKSEESSASRFERARAFPEWIHEEDQEPSKPETTSTPEASQEDVSITSWLSKLDVQEALSKNQPAPDTQQPESATSNELPDWLKDLEKPSVNEVAPKAAEDLPDWLRQPAEPADQGTTAEQTPDPLRVPEIPAWVDEEIPVSEQTSPTSPGEWLPVDEKPAQDQALQPDVEPKSTGDKIPAQYRVPGGTGMLARIPSQDKDAELLVSAQAALDANKLNEAMQAYAALIKKNRLLDEVIHDLREAIYRFPVDIIVWQTLGDASMRANRLQDALDAYTKAEELLR